MSQNPYEAPQTLATRGVVSAVNEAVEVGPEILLVMRGAKWCYQAILIIATAVLIVFVLGFLLPREIAPLAGLGLLLVLVVAAVMHVIGVFQMRQVDPQSRARGLLLVSVVAYGIVVLSYAAILGLTYYRITLDVPLGFLAVDLLAMTATLTLMLALLRIGEYLKQPAVSSNAKTALIFFGILYATNILISGLLLIPAIQATVAEFQRKNTILSSVKPIYFSLLMIATIFYVKSLDAIVKLLNIIEHPATAPSFLDGVATNPTKPGEEMNFLNQ